MHAGWDKEGTMSRLLSGSHWPPGAEEVTILLIATIFKLFGSMYIHQNSRAIASLIATRTGSLQGFLGICSG